MNKDEIIAAKLTSTWKESWKIFDDSCKYSIANNLDFIVGVLLAREQSVSHNEFKSISEQLQDYLSNTLGFKNNYVTHRSQFYTRKGYEAGVGFVVFLSSAAIKAYMKESDDWQKSIQGNSRNTVQTPRPIYEKIQYLNIYKKPEKIKK